VTTSTWNVSTSGNWNNPADWLGGVPNSSTTDVVISIAGKYTVDLGSGETYAVHNVTLNNATATLQIDGTLNLAGAMTLTAGTLTLDGTISGGTIVAGGGTTTFAGGTLSGVTYQGTLNFSAASSSLTVVDGLTMTGSGGSGAGTINLTGIYDIPGFLGLAKKGVDGDSRKDSCLRHDSRRIS
jgi:hypothetical protein